MLYPVGTSTEVLTLMPTSFVRNLKKNYFNFVWARAPTSGIPYKMTRLIKSRSWPIRKRPTGFSQQPFSQPLTQYKSTTDLTYLHRQELATDPTAVKLNRAKQTTRLPKPLAEPPKLFHQLRCLRLATKPAATGSTS